jgi:hypothetical protein
MALTRKQKRERMLQKRDAHMAGDGLYIFQNITGADLMLPRPTKAGRRTVGPREKFIGDSYYKQMKEVVCLQEVQAPMETANQEQKLLTEVPPTVTHEGKVEYVQKQPGQKPLTEDKKKDNKNEQEDVLLTESPLEGIRIMR